MPSSSRQTETERTRRRLAVQQAFLRQEAWIYRSLGARGRPVEVAEAGEPEVRQLTFGILPLTDCAPIVVAHSKGFFLRHGIESSVTKFGSWTASRDGLMRGKAQAAHMLFGMPVAAAVGKLGTEHKPLVIPWILNRNGQAITVSARHRASPQLQCA